MSENVVRVLQAGRPDLDGSLSEAEYLRLSASSLIVECPNCSAKLQQRLEQSNDNKLQPVARAKVYHPIRADASSEDEMNAKADKIEEQIADTLAASTH